jgi:hypothetical protein
MYCIFIYDRDAEEAFGHCFAYRLEKAYEMQAELEAKTSHAVIIDASRAPRSGQLAHHYSDRCEDC